MIKKAKIDKRLKKKTDLRLIKLVNEIKKSDSEFWLKVAKYLVRPKREQVEVNLGKINAIANDGDVILIPGKVLANGVLDKKIIISCYKASGNAIKKIEFSKSKLISIEELFRKNKTGEGIRLIV
ncbi:MAG: 50S ribosomal protein L18e [Candidatus Pacearchaeota archaeon]